MLLFIVVVLILEKLSKVCDTKQKYLLKKSRQWKAQIFWGVLIRFSIEIYLEILVCTLINLVSRDELEGGEVMKQAANWYSYFATAILLVLPFLYIRLIKRNKKEIVREDYVSYVDFCHAKVYNKRFRKISYPLKQKYGALYEDLNIYNSASLMYNPLQLIRRLILALAFVLMVNHPLMQLFVVIFNSVAFIIYFNLARPFFIRNTHKLELINECLNMLVIYTFFLFTDFVSDPLMRYSIGWANIGVIFVMIFFNMSIIIAKMLRNCCLKCRAKVAKPDNKAIQKLQELSSIDSSRKQREILRELKLVRVKVKDGKPIKQVQKQRVGPDSQVMI